MPLIVQVPVNAEVPDGYAGALNVLDRKQTAVQRQLRRSGLAGYEPLTQAVLLGLAQEAPVGSMVLDIGAHVGIYSALLDSIYRGKELQVVAFEPTPETAAVCRRLRDVNGLRFELVEAAVGSAPGEAELYLSAKAETSNSLNAGHRRHLGSVSVQVTTVDEFVGQRDARPFLMKVDVETFEAQVLNGSLQVLEHHRPWIVCELLPSSDSAALEAPLAALERLGYGFHCIAPETPWPRRGAGDYRPHLNGACRDWLLAPDPLTAAQYHRIRAWLGAILRCDERTNLLLPPGEAPPIGWDAPTSADDPEVQLLRRRLAEAQREVRDLRGSVSFRLGRRLTALPRRLRR